MALSTLNLYRGLDGTVTQPLNLHIFSWAMRRTAELLPKPGFGDSQDVRLTENSISYQFSFNAWPTTASKIVTSGTSQVTLAAGTHSYAGPAWFGILEEGYDQQSGQTFVRASGQFEGAPTAL